jgi:hypothetical protein
VRLATSFATTTEEIARFVGIAARMARTDISKRRFENETCDSRSAVRIAGAR